MIPFIKPYFDEDDYQAIRQALQSGWVAQGPKVEELEVAVARYLVCRHVVSTTNCTAALTLALMALEIGAGDEVIMPSFTFPATAIAIANVGATPVFLDVSLHDYNIIPEMIENALTEQTRAIIPVHLFGKACDMNAIMDVAEDHGLFVIEDAACSLGAIDSETRAVGTIGDVGCFSLHASKGITTGEGGLICTNDPVVAQTIRRLTSFGDERAFRRSINKASFRFDPAAGNYKMSDITAALALSQLKKIEMLIDWRVRIAKEWNDVIGNDAFLSDNITSVPFIDTDRTHIYQSYVAVCRDGQRPAVMKYMADKGFQCGIGTHACHRYESIIDLEGGVHNLANSDYLHDHAISFPRYYGLNVKEEWYNAKKSGH